MPTILDLTGDANDDWLKKANPDYRTSEAAAHAAALELHQQAMTAEKALDVYTVPMLDFEVWPTALDLEFMASEVAARGLTWQEVVANYKTTHHIENETWVANA